MSLKPMCPAGTSLDSLVLANLSFISVPVTSLLSNATPTLKGLFRAIKKKYIKEFLCTYKKLKMSLYTLFVLTETIVLIIANDIYFFL